MIKLWTYLGAAAAAIAVLTGAVYYIDKNAAARVQARWDRAVLADHLTANKAIDDADLQIPALTDEERDADRAIVPRSNPCRVPDPWDRDCKN